ncbi:hypothetical protein TorRG33x02_124240 [Trema orientale]|uniref:Uncharacterized protein n=1 Tax=Trema orientale TaxID=63057 RepID=A0A2P5F208_TREOI|nr:hypothetical protein TorRG33x02_124240 [Trema orientale]
MLDLFFRKSCPPLNSSNSFPPGYAYRSLSSEKRNENHWPNDIPALAAWVEQNNLYFGEFGGRLMERNIK